MEELGLMEIMEMQRLGELLEEYVGLQIEDYSEILA